MELKESNIINMNINSKSGIFGNYLNKKSSQFKNTFKNSRMFFSISLIDCQID